MKKLNEVYPNWYASGTGLAGGFFSQLLTYLQTAQIECEWLSDASAAYNLDIAYHGNCSGEKPIASLLENMLIDGVMTSHAAQRVAGMFWALFGVNLQKQYATLSAEYNPLNNYDMTESGTDTKTGDDTTTYSGQTQDSTSGGYTNSTYGFDSSTAVPSDSNTNSSTVTHTFTDRNDKTDYNTTTEHGFERHGNIGVMSSQDLLTQEHELWIWNFYKSYLFPVVDSVLTLPIYLQN